MTNTLKAKSDLITSRDFITQGLVCQKLGIQPGSAANLLTLWNNEGILRRISPGVYLSSSAIASSNDLVQAQLRNIKQRVDDELVLVGSSAWEREGWCKSTVLHVAITARPSRRMPKILDCMLHPVGAKHSLHLINNSCLDKETGMAYLHPVLQMLWWMERECSIPMPAPTDVNWNTLNDRVDLREAMLAQWPEFLEMPSMDARAIYEMIYMDRLTNTWSGPGGYLEDLDESEAEEENAMAPAAG